MNTDIDGLKLINITSENLSNESKREVPNAYRLGLIQNLSLMNQIITENAIYVMYLFRNYITL